MKKRQYSPRLAVVYYFRASTRCAFSPFVVQRNTLYVEILVGGAVCYEGNTYRRGTVFCHAAGDMTLHDFPKNQPYRVLLLLFENYDRKKWNLPHIGQWRHLASLDSFVHDALEDFHLKTDPGLLAEYLFTSLRQNLLVVPDITVDRRAELAREIFVVRDKLEHLDEDINWQEFSLVRAGYSPVYLRTFFKEQFNIPPYQYRLRYRIQTACKLLVESTLSIREISEKTRFRNLETFYRAFKKQTGTTPAQYRRKNSSHQ